jgi:hypothetical protein
MKIVLTPEEALTIRTDNGTEHDPSLDTTTVEELLALLNDPVSGYVKVMQIWYSVGKRKGLDWFAMDTQNLAARIVAIVQAARALKPKVYHTNRRSFDHRADWFWTGDGQGPVGPFESKEAAYSDLDRVLGHRD